MYDFRCVLGFRKWPGHNFILKLGLFILFVALPDLAGAQLDQPDGPLPWSSWWGISQELYGEELNDYRRKGYRPIDVEIVGGAKRTYGLVMRKDEVNPPWAIHTRLTESEFHAKWVDYKKQGYRPIDQESYTLKDTQFYAGIWIKDSVSSWSSYRNLTLAQFQEKSETHRKKGYLPIDVDAYVMDGQLTFSGIFVKNDGSIDWFVQGDVKQEDFGKHFQEMVDKGFRLYDTNAYSFESHQFFAVIWVKDKRRWTAKWDLDSISFHNLSASNRDKGYRLEDLEMYPTKDGIRYAGIWLENNPDLLTWKHRDTVINLVNTYLTDNPSMGFSMAIHQDGKLRILKGWGLADQKTGKEAHSRTVYRYASASKAVTSVVGQILKRDDTIEFSEPIRDILTKLPRHHAYSLEDLLSVRSGVCHYEGCGKFDNTPIDLHSSSGMWAGVKKFMDKPLSETRGTLFYSTHGYTIAAAAFEKATGQPFQTLLEANINVPLDIGIFCEDLKKDNGERSQIYTVKASDKTLEKATAADIRWKCGGGGMEGTVYDLSALGAALEENSLLSEVEKTEMLTAPDNQRRRGNLFAYGWVVNSLKSGGTINWYATGGDQTGARAYLMVYPEMKLVIALTGNTRGTGYRILVDNIAAAIGP